MRSEIPGMILAFMADAAIKRERAKRERRRKIFLIASAFVLGICFGFQICWMILQS